jgi:hypothetical protein
MWGQTTSVDFFDLLMTCRQDLISLHIIAGNGTVWLFEVIVLDWVQCHMPKNRDHPKIM